MSMHGWSSDAPSGVYKNHKLSAQIREASLRKTVFAPFATPEPGFGPGSGETHNITRVANVAVPNSSLLDEFTRISEDNVALSTQAVTVAEYGRGIPYTSLAVDLAHFDLANKIQKALRKQLQVVMDNLVAAAFKTGQILAICTGDADITFETDGAASNPATDNFNGFHAEQIRDYMFGTLNIETMEDGNYVGILHTNALRGLKNDPDWKDWMKYIKPEMKLNSEAGMYEGIRFVESNNNDALDGTIGTGSVAAEGVFFGDDCVASAFVQEPELRLKAPGDYGRDRGVAWYAIMAFVQIFADSSSAGEARSVYMTSST